MILLLNGAFTWSNCLIRSPGMTMDDHEFFATQSAILADLLDALVEATPESWNEATLELHQSKEGCGHVIRSLEHPRDIVTATDEVFAATSRLEQLFRDRGEPWTRVVFIARKNLEGDEKTWRYEINYRY